MVQEIGHRWYIIYCLSWVCLMFGTVIVLIYLLFNPNLMFSEVLGTVQNALFRKVLTRLRLSSHHLKIETGRWHKPCTPIPRNERLCKICNVLEDDYHFICEYPVYNDIIYNESYTCILQK